MILLNTSVAVWPHRERNMWSRERARTVGERVGQARRAANLTQAEVAHQVTDLGIVFTQALLSRLERGEATEGYYDSIDLLQAIATVTASDAARLMHGAGGNPLPVRERTAEDAGRQHGWTPQPGDHVRVRGISATLCEECPHLGGEVGVTGKVVAELAAPGAPSHPFLVIFDEPLIWEARPACFVEVRVRHFAAHELQPA